MISPELLKKHAFFCCLTESQLNELAMIAEEEFYEAGTNILEADAPVQALYLLTKGHIDLFAVSQDKHASQRRKEFLVGEINPGEPFGIPALNEPYLSIALLRAESACTAIKIEANALRDLCEKDHDLGYALMRQIVRHVIERLAYTQAQLAAARA